MTPAQSRVARALLNWTVHDLSGHLRGKVSVRTLFDFEGEKRTPQATTTEALLKVYTASGIIFDSDGVNVRLTVKKKRGA